MDDDREVLDRLERIEQLDEAGVPAAELLGEVRALLRAAERVARRSDDAELDLAVARTHAALETGARDAARHVEGDGAVSAWPLVTVLDRPA